MNHPRTFSIGRLFYKYIKDSELEGRFKDSDLADTLEALGFIKLTEDRTRYSELEAFEPYKDRDALHLYFCSKLVR